MKASAGSVSHMNHVTKQSIYIRHGHFHCQIQNRLVYINWIWLFNNWYYCVWVSIILPVRIFCQKFISMWEKKAYILWFIICLRSIHLMYDIWYDHYAHILYKACFCQWMSECMYYSDCTCEPASRRYLTMILTDLFKCHVVSVYVPESCENRSRGREEVVTFSLNSRISRQKNSDEKQIQY